MEAESVMVVMEQLNSVQQSVRIAQSLKISCSLVLMAIKNIKL